MSLFAFKKTKGKKNKRRYLSSKSMTSALEDSQTPAGTTSGAVSKKVLKHGFTPKCSNALAAVVHQHNNLSISTAALLAAFEIPEKSILGEGKGW